jgi:hypothetical protein
VGESWCSWVEWTIASSHAADSELTRALGEFQMTNFEFRMRAMIAHRWIWSAVGCLSFVVKTGSRLIRVPTSEGIGRYRKPTDGSKNFGGRNSSLEEMSLTPDNGT